MTWFWISFAVLVFVVIAGGYVIVRLYGRDR